MTPLGLETSLGKGHETTYSLPDWMNWREKRKKDKKRVSIRINEVGWDKSKWSNRRFQQGMDEAMEFFCQFSTMDRRFLFLTKTPTNMPQPSQTCSDVLFRWSWEEAFLTYILPPPYFPWREKEIPQTHTYKEICKNKNTRKMKIRVSRMFHFLQNFSGAF